MFSNLNNLSAINTSGNNPPDNHHQYNSLSRIGLKKISSGNSNNSPRHTFMSQQKLLGASGKMSVNFKST